MDFYRFSGIVGPIWWGQIKFLTFRKILYDVFLDVEYDKTINKKIQGGL